MRFREVSAIYALFGPFQIGVRLPLEKPGGWLEGKLQHNCLERPQWVVCRWSQQNPS